jgi:hypothetical protein
MPTGQRAEDFAAEFEAAQSEFIKLVESLTDAEWRMVGQNYPKRINDEDEGRPVGVIAHHVAVDAPWIMQRIQATVAGRQPPPFDIQKKNAKHARDEAEVTRDEVLRLLGENKAPIAASLREVPDDQLEVATDTAVGPMTVASRIQAVLIGHIKMHQGSIEATIGR